MNEKKTGVWNNMGAVDILKKLYGIDASKVTASVKGFRLPLEFWNPAAKEEEKLNIFQDVGKALIYLAQKQFPAFGRVALDSVWQKSDAKILAETMDGAGGFGAAEIAIKMAELKEKYPTPFDNHLVYIGIAFVDIDDSDTSEQELLHPKTTDINYKFKVVSQSERKEKGKKGETVYNNPTVEFEVCQFYVPELGFKDKTDLDDESKILPRGEPKWVKFNTFVSKEQITEWLGIIKECQIERKTTPNKSPSESVYLVVKGIYPRDKDGKEYGNLGLNWDPQYVSLKGTLDAVWCWND